MINILVVVDKMWKTLRKNLSKSLRKKSPMFVDNIKTAVSLWESRSCTHFLHKVLLWFYTKLIPVFTPVKSRDLHSFHIAYYYYYEIYY
jgi:hypothetical protein